LPSQAPCTIVEVLAEREGVAFKPGIPMEVVVLKYEAGPLFASRRT
jgi:hypothetical protein